MMKWIFSEFGARDSAAAAVFLHQLQRRKSQESHWDRWFSPEFVVAKSDVFPIMETSSEMSVIMDANRTLYYCTVYLKVKTGLDGIF